MIYSSIAAFYCLFWKSSVKATTTPVEPGKNNKLVGRGAIPEPIPEAHKDKKEKTTHVSSYVLIKLISLEVGVFVPCRQYVMWLKTESDLRSSSWYRSELFCWSKQGEDGSDIS